MVSAFWPGEKFSLFPGFFPEEKIKKKRQRK
jgi:hypothetical protein